MKLAKQLSPPKKAFKLKNKGKIAKDYFADLVAFDPENIKNNATYKNPRRAPDKIEYVIVNGKIAIYKEKGNRNVFRSSN